MALVLGYSDFALEVLNKYEQFFGDADLQRRAVEDIFKIDLEQACSIVDDLVKECEQKPQEAYRNLLAFMSRIRTNANVDDIGFL